MSENSDKIGPSPAVPPSGQPRDISDINTIRMFIRPCSSATRESLQARAIPNARLVRVFGISNAFVTSDLSKKQRFVGDAIARLRSTIGQDGFEGFENLRDHARAARDEYLSRGGSREANEYECGIVDLVSFVTLTVTLYYIYPNRHDDGVSKQNPVTKPQPANSKNKDDRKDMTDNILFIAREINRLWITSKVPADTTNWADQTALHKALEAATGFQLTPSQNPMNWLLPAYETMWRIVLRCLLEVQFRGHASASAWRCAMVQFANYPSQKSFHARESASREHTQASTQSPSAMDIVKEGLRLYPPSRRIYRQYDLHKPPVVANIEACHRSRFLGGSTPLEFRPKRWQEIERLCQEKQGGHDGQQQQRTGFSGGLREFEEALGYMPFGLVCPAGGSLGKGFAFRFIGLLVGVLCEAIGDKWHLSDALPEINEPLQTGRNSYHKLRVRFEQQ